MYKILVSKYMFPKELYTFEKARRNYYCDEETGYVLEEYEDIIDEIEKDYYESLEKAVLDKLNSVLNFPFEIIRVTFEFDGLYAWIGEISPNDILIAIGNHDDKIGLVDFLNGSCIDDYLDMFMIYAVESSENWDEINIYYDIIRNI